MSHRFETSAQFHARSDSIRAAFIARREAAARIAPEPARPSLARAIGAAFPLARGPVPGNS